MTMLRQDAFGVKLYAVERACLVVDGHDLAVSAEGVGDQFVGQIFGADRQGVVAYGVEGLGQAFEKRATCMGDGADLAVANLACGDDLAAHCLSDALMAEADAEDGKDFWGLADQFDANACLVRCAWAGRQDHAVWFQGESLCDGELVIADDLCVCANFLKIVDEVPGETVIIIDDEDVFPGH